MYDVHCTILLNWFIQRLVMISDKNNHYAKKGMKLSWWKTLFGIKIDQSVLIPGPVDDCSNLYPSNAIGVTCSMGSRLFDIQTNEQV